MSDTKKIRQRKVYFHASRHSDFDPNLSVIDVRGRDEAVAQMRQFWESLSEEDKEEIEVPLWENARQTWSYTHTDCGYTFDENICGICGEYLKGNGRKVWTVELIWKPKDNA